MTDRNRQTGRTSRIVDFVVDQLFNVGQCIVTDHIVFEFESTKKSQLEDGLIRKVQERVAFNLRHFEKPIKLNTEIIEVKGFKIVHFELNV
jgi:hypothetical protein